jgi:uncharacterized protein
VKNIGKIVWRDLTVPNADEIKDFYVHVIGWHADEHDMGDYADHNIRTSPTEEPIAGICHARGMNANVPAQWLIYVQVDDVHAAVQRCRDAGGSIVDGPRKMGASDFCVIKDPAGAVLALIS